MLYLLSTYYVPHTVEEFIYIVNNFLNNIYIFVYLFISGCAGSSLLPTFSLVAASRGCSLVVVRGFLIAVASLVVERGL